MSPHDENLLLGNMARAWEALQPSGILCHRFKFIYFPVSKVGGSSIKTMIAEMEGIPIHGNPHTLPFEFVRYKNLKNYPDYKRVTFVRNPWDRIRSCYRDKIFWQKKESGEIVRRTQIFAGFGRYNKVLGRKIFHPDMTFEQFVRVVARIPDVFADRHIRSQYKAFYYPGTTCLADCIVRMEHFQEDMQAFLSSVGADSFEIKHLHKTRASKGSEQFDDELADIVARRYRRDIELLHYTRPQKGDIPLGVQVAP